MENEIFFLIPARAGSKGIKNKNSKEFGGKPLICHTIDSVNGLSDKKNIIVSTNCPKIQSICMNDYENDVTLHKRPESISGDESTINQTVEEIMHMLGKNIERCSLCLLQPTSPLRNTDDIKRAIEIHRYNNYENLVSVNRVKHSGSPEKLLIKVSENKAFSYLGESKAIQRQDLKSEYLSRNGAIYISSLKTIKMGFIRKKSLFYEMPVWRSIDIDTLEDWIIAEMYLKNKKDLNLI